MATIASILRILVNAETTEATSKLDRFDKQMAATRSKAARDIEAHLGANFDRSAFDAYERKLADTQRRVKDRAAFKAALGGDFNAAGFNAYQRALTKTEADSRRTANAVSNLDNRFGGLSKSVGDFNQVGKAFGNILTLVKFPAMIAGAGMATQAVGALAAGAVGLVSALGPLAGMGAAGGAGLVAMAQGLGVVKLAFADVTKALAGNKKALAALTPSQKTFLTDLKAMKTQVKGLQEAAAAGLLPGLGVALKTITPLFAVLKPIITATGEALGQLAVNAAKSVNGWGKDLTTIGKTNITVLQNVGGAVIALATAFKDIVVVAGPLVTWMSGLVLRGARFVEVQVAAARASGRLAEFLEKTRATMTTLGHTAENVIVSLWNIGKAAFGMGNSLAGSLEGVTKKWREWTGSVTGQQTLTAYFDAAKPGVLAIAGLVGDLVKALTHISQGGGMAGWVGQIRAVLPSLQAVIVQTTKALGPALITALANVVTLFGQLGGTSGPLNMLVRGLGMMAGAITAILKAVPGLDTIVVALVGLGAVGKILVGLFGPLVGGVQTAMRAWGRLSGAAETSAAAQSAAAVKGATAAEEASLGVGKLALAWDRVTAAARVAMGAQGGTSSLAGAAGKPGGVAAAGATTAGKSGSGLILPAGVSAGTSSRALAAEEKAVTSRFSGMTSKLSGMARTAMKGAGIALGGIMATQMASSIVGGSAGKWISAIGTGGSLGAALGSVFGPGGMAAGAIVGGLGGAVVHFFSGPSFAQKTADAITTGGLGGILNKQLNAQIAKLVEQSTPKTVTPPKEKFMPSYKAQPSSVVLPLTPAQHSAAYQLGVATIKAVEAGWKQYPFQDEPVMFQQFRARVKNLAPEAQAAAMESAVAMSRGLEAHGQLVKGSTAKLINDIKNQFPELTRYLGGSAAAGSAAFTANLNFKMASNKARSALAGIGNDFAGVRELMITTSGGVEQKANAMASSLRHIAEHGTAQMRPQAIRDLRALQATMVDVFTTAGGVVTSKMSEIGGAVTSGSRGAARSAGKYWGQYVTSIQDAETAGALTVAAGNKLIADQLAKALQSMGVSAKDAAALGKAGYGVGEAAKFIAGAASSGASSGAGNNTIGGGSYQYKATGGKITKPMAIVGEEAPNHPEYVIASNPAYRKRNLGLWAQAGQHLGVPGFAQGGVVGQIDQILTGYGFTRNAIAGMLGNAQQESSMNPNAPGGGLWQQITNFGQGTGGSVAAQIAKMVSQLGGIREALNAAKTPGAAAVIFEQGFEKAGIVAMENRIRYAEQAAAGNLTGGSGGGGVTAPTLTPPKVGGSGMIAALAQGVLNNTTAAANIVLQKAVPLANLLNTAGGGGGSGGAPGTVMATSGKAADVQTAMMTAANQIVGLPYVWGGGHGSFSASGYDCSGAVSYLLHAAGLLSSPLDTVGLQSWGLPGGGKNITVGVRGGAGASGHTMMSFFGKFFESGGAAGAGPHWDSSWDGVFPVSRHPPGLARGGKVGDFGDVPPAVLLAGNPAVAKLPEFAEYSRRFGPKAKYAGAFAHGGMVTASSPTMAMFGENGAETAVFLPHFAKGGVVGGAYHSALPITTISRGRQSGIPAQFSLSNQMVGAPTMTPLPDPEKWGGAYKQLTSKFEDLGAITKAVRETFKRVYDLEPALAETMGRVINAQSTEQWSFITTPPPITSADGTVTQPDSKINQVDVNARVAEINKLIAQYEQRQKWLKEALSYIAQARAALPRMIKRRQDEVARVRELIRSYMPDLQNAERAYAKEQQWTMPVIAAAGGKMTPAQRHADTLRRAEARRAQTVGHKARLTSLSAQVKNLRGRNVALGGDPERPGTGGWIGELIKMRTVLTDEYRPQLDTSQFDLVGYGNGGKLGDLADAIATLQTEKGTLDTSVGGALSQQIAALNGANAAATAATAGATAAGGAAGAGGTTPSAVDTFTAATQLKLTQQLAVSEAQLGVLKDWSKTMPAFGGSFATGGIVPGAPGAPRVVIAHGGEAIGQLASDTPTRVHVVLEDHRTQVFVNDIEQVIEQSNRRTARAASRQLPGGRYG